jgi:uncharacterized protein YjbJ (UPF0337 family)
MTSLLILLVYDPLSWHFFFSSFLLYLGHIFPARNFSKVTQNPKMSSNANPSMFNGHAQYAKGYVEETIGNVTGSKDWQESGQKDAQSGIDEMKV